MSEEREIIETASSGAFGDDMSIDKAKDAKGTAFRLIKELMRQKWKIIVVFISIIAASVFDVLSPRLIGDAINQIFDGIQSAITTGGVFQVNIHTLGGVMASLLALYLLSALFNYIQQYIMASVAQNLTLSMRKQINSKLNKLPLRYYDTHKKGEILSRVTSDLEKVADSLQEGLTQLLSSVVGIVGAFVMMLFISPLLTLIALGTIFVSIFVSVLISGRTLRYHAENQKALGELNANIEEVFTGNTVVKALNLQDDMIKTTEELTENLCKAGRKAQFTTYAINPVVRFLNQIGYVVVAVRGAMSVLQGKITIGDIQAFFQYINQVSEPVTQLAYIVNSLQGAIASAERVYQIQDELEEIPDKSAEIKLPSPKGAVCFENVRFGYSDDAILLDDININVKAGSKIAIVGPTGAGKTTLVNLLMRFYELQGGKITIDGVDITDMCRKDLRSMLGMVLQDTWLFTGTIAENISYGRANASENEIRQAAKTAGIDHFIRTLPEGYQTVLDDEVSSTSVGQKQLLTIARAILADPAILILDEATSSVDTRTEVEIQKAMNALMKDRTSFIIAHRLSTIRDADLILVMHNGNIIEQGTHMDLMKLNGFYENLYNSQFSLETA